LQKTHINLGQFWKGGTLAGHCQAGELSSVEKILDWSVGFGFLLIGSVNISRGREQLALLYAR
jgi:hypothetical protein